jgi:hypothetical protein
VRSLREEERAQTIKSTQDHERETDAKDDGEEPQEQLPWMKFSQEIGCDHC